ncbi:hypothetical protein [Petrotoga sp. 9PWA.NaAc.5.4]|uniref:hypothetical protein n=1 Tax=Petrotoga sp. 9PWA.NaAc.5.4 TaxID=1434328 RepID=UPI0011B6D3A5|nr:hypothetical protein [Petrotoga sp. 9PWA.NaAc.5.4]
MEKYTLLTENPISKDCDSENLVKELEKILNTEMIIEKLSIKRKNYSLLELKDEFVISSSFSYPQFNYIAENIDSLEVTKYIALNNSNLFSYFEIELNELWKYKDSLPKYETQGIEFAGYFKDSKGEIISFIYFYDSLLKLAIGDKLGENKVIAAFKDGILLIDEDGQIKALYK